MESQRSLLVIALLVVSFLLYQQWQLDHAPKPQISETANSTMSTNNSDSDFVPQSSSDSGLPEVTAAQSKIVSVKTDVLDVQISTQGGDLVSAKLLKYETELGSNEPFVLMDLHRLKYIAQSGLIGAQGPDASAEGRPTYHVDSTSFELSDSQDTLTVDLTFVGNNGIEVTKRYNFYRGQYRVDVDFIVNNKSNSAASVQLYAQLKQSTLTSDSNGMVMTYKGAAYSTDETLYEKYDFGDFEDGNLNIGTKGGWVAMLQHYFVSAWVPNAESANTIYTSQLNNAQVAIGVKSPIDVINPNNQGELKATLYLGPKDQEALENIASGLDLTVDYGILFFISQPLFWLLVKIQSFVSNWGVAIILITVVVKGVLYPLTKAQYTSMAKMRKLQPKLQSLKERYGNDKQKMTQAMMDLYRKEKVNPAGGCFPLLLQMPIFLALYWVFVESVELRHAPFALWINDLSAMDPFFVLPILMGISMWMMQKMQPMTIQDPMQQKIMQFMPWMFTAFMAFFPSGLVLYWFISNVISIIQMKIIFMGIEKADAKA